MPGIRALNEKLERGASSPNSSYKGKKRELVKGKNETNIVKSKIDEYLVEQRKKDSLEYSNRNSEKTRSFHPSTIGNDCERLLYLHYWRMLPEEKISPQLNRIFANGHFAENRFFRYFLEMRIFKDREARVLSENPPIRGRADFLVNLPQEDGKDKVHIIELKTINDKGFESLTNAKPEHIIQIQIYLNLLDIDAGFVLYENKNNQELREFYFEKDPQVWDKIRKKLLKVMKMKEIPDVPKKNHSKYCNCLAYRKDK